MVHNEEYSNTVFSPANSSEHLLSQIYPWPSLSALQCDPEGRPPSPGSHVPKVQAGFHPPGKRYVSLEEEGSGGFQIMFPTPQPLVVTQAAAEDSTA